MATYEQIASLNLETYLTYIEYENPYINYRYYAEIFGGNILKENTADKYLKSASNDVDTLTYNRIVALGGINKLTNFQKPIVGEIVCKLAEFKFENEDLLDSLVSSYSIDNVSINFNQAQGVKNINGVIIPTSLYNRLAQTGLTCRNLRY